MSVVVNGAFRPQRVSGQQRYAHEIADRLVTRDGFREVAPTGRWVGSAVREWGWTVTRLPRLARGETVLSLTARSPLTGPQVVVVHDLFVLTHPQWYSRRYIATHAPLLRAHLRHARALVAVSAPVADQIAEHAGRTASVAPNAPSEAFRRPEAADAPLGHGLRAGGYLLTVGNQDSRKNLARLAAAWGRIDPAVRESCPLVVVGGGADIYRAGRIDWPSGTIGVGYVTDEELGTLYAGARAVVFPSLAEGFGLPIVEAVAAGAAGLVVSDIPVFRWICGDGATYVDPLSEESIADALTAAIEGRVVPATLARSFSWDESAEVVARTCLAAAKGAP